MHHHIQTTARNALLLAALLGVTAANAQQSCNTVGFINTFTHTVQSTAESGVEDVRFRWSLIDPCDRGVVSIAINRNGSQVWSTSDGSARTHTDQRVPTGAQYNYQLRVVFLGIANRGGVPRITRTESVTVAVGNGSEITRIEWSESDDRVYLEWSHFGFAGNTAHSVYRKPCNLADTSCTEANMASTFGWVGQANNNGRAFQDRLNFRGLARGINYEYQIRQTAVGSMSAARNVDIPILVPNAPTFTRAGNNAPGHDSLHLVWTEATLPANAPPITAYVLRRSSGASAATDDADWTEFRQRAGTPLTTLSITDRGDSCTAGTSTCTEGSGLMPNTQYWYQILAANSAGRGAWSANFGRSTAAPPPLTLSEKSTTTTSITLTGTVTNVGTGVDLVLRYVAKGAGSCPAVTASVATVYTSRKDFPDLGAPSDLTEDLEITGLMAGTAYCFALYRVDNPATSHATLEASTTAAAQTQPMLSVSDITATSFILTWTNDVTTDILEVETSTGDYTPMFSTDALGLSMPPVTVTAATTVLNAAHITAIHNRQTPRNFRVRDTKGTGIDNSDDTFSNVLLVPPDAEARTVEVVSATPSAAGITVVWEWSPTDDTSLDFALVRCTGVDCNTDGNPNVIATRTDGATMFVDTASGATPLVANQTYGYQIQPRGHSAFIHSPVLHAQFVPPLELAGAGVGVGDTTVTHESITLRWTGGMAVPQFCRDGTAACTDPIGLLGAFVNPPFTVPSGIPRDSGNDFYEFKNLVTAAIMPGATVYFRVATADENSPVAGFTIPTAPVTEPAECPDGQTRNADGDCEAVVVTPPDDAPTQVVFSTSPPTPAGARRLIVVRPGAVVIARIGITDADTDYSAVTYAWTQTSTADGELEVADTHAYYALTAATGTNAAEVRVPIAHLFMDAAGNPAHMDAEGAVPAPSVDLHFRLGVDNCPPGHTAPCERDDRFTVRILTPPTNGRGGNDEVVNRAVLPQTLRHMTDSIHKSIFDRIKERQVRDGFWKP